MRIPKLKIRSKFVLAILLITFLPGLITTVFFHTTMTWALTHELQERGVVVTKNLASNAAEPLLTEDLLTLQRLLNSVKEVEEDVAYVYITSPGGHIRAHTFEDGFPKELLGVNVVSNQDHSAQLLDTDAGYIRDIAVPILEGRAGSVHVGMSEINIRNNIILMTRALIGVTFLLVLNGALLAYTVGNMMAKPIYAITRGAEEVGKGNLDYVIKVKGGDEIGELAKAFNQMTRNLKTSTDMLVQSEKLASLGQLAAGLAHEINNPLTNILLDAEAIRDMEMDEDTRKERLDEIVSQVEATGKIVTNLLEFSRQSEPMTLPTEIEKLIDEALEIATLNIGDVEVIKDYEGNLPEVRGDPIQLKQVFLNIILNSLQAMPKGGRLEIATSMEDEFIKISFEDTGTGISGENLNKVFDPFFTTKKVGEGTGLGLSICLGIIERHGGKIDVQSQPGKGSVFTVRLPAGVKDG